MSYLGRGLEQVDNISKLDNITFNGGTTYALTKDSAAFTPISSNAILISIDGVVQQGNFSVSGTNIVFNFSPTSSNTCNWILHMGTGVAFTPADSSVTKDKANFISTSSAAGLQIKGDGTTDGTLQLNCSQNSHGVKIKSPAHSAGQSYTLTLPATAPATDKMLQTNSSGVLSFVDAPSGAATLINSSAATTGDSLLALSNVFSSTYEVYVVDVLGYQPSAAGYLLSQLANSGGYLGSAINYFSGLGKQDENSEVDNHVAGSGQTAIYLHPTSTRSDDHLNMKINIYLPTGVGTYKPKMFYTGVYIQDSGSKSTAFFGQTSVDTTSTITGMKFYPSTGTINDLQVKVYGFQKAT